MIRGKAVLITGGGGFIGVSLAERLAEHNQVVLFDRDFVHNAWSYTNLQGHPNISLVEGDILDAHRVAQVAMDAQIVIHAAAVVGVQAVLHDAVHTMEVNLLGTSHLLKAVKTARCERFLFLSTSEIYGLQALHVREEAPVFLPHTADARWTYTVSKIAGEHLVMAYHRQMGLPVVIARPFNIFGPRRVGDYAILRFILQALRGQALEVYGDGTQVRAWCYIDDLCDGLLRCLETPEAVGLVFNLGNPGNAISVYELAKAIVRLAGSSSPITFCPLPFSDIVVRIPDISRAASLLGFTPKVNLEEGLLKTIIWVREHVRHLEPILDSRKAPGNHRESLENG